MKHLALTAVLALAACQTTGGSGAGVKLYALDCGTFDMKDAASFSVAGDYNGQPAKLVDPCYLIRHPKGDLMWDAGIAPAMKTPAGASPPTIIGREKTIPEQLAQLGMKVEEVEFFSVSHSHFDHLGEGNLFAPAATWIVDKDERDWMFRPDGRKAIGFNNYAQLETAKTKLVEGDGDYDVFGDGSVTMVQTPGHTPGHMVLLVKTKGSGNFLLAGDMWHLAQAREKRTIPTSNTDREQTLKSMDKVEALAKATNAKVIRQHVPEDFAALPKFPAAAE
jgi:N-acyl homoserine lactone hydrolase